MAEYLVKFELPTGVSFMKKLDGNIHLSPHFTVKELANTKGNPMLPQLVINRKVLEFLNMLEELRAYCGVPIDVNSFYRQPAYNASVGGASNSLHLDGLAIDWEKTDYSDLQRMHVKDKWEGITTAHGTVGGINYYTRGFHLSYDESKFGYTRFVHRDYRGKKGDW